MADDKSGNVVQSTIIRVDHLCCQGEAALVRKLLEPFEACLQNANTRGRSTQDPSVAARNERSRANGSYQRPSRMDANSPFSCHSSLARRRTSLRSRSASMTAAALSTTGRSLRRSPVIAKPNDITSCANQNPCIARLAHCAPQAAEIVRILNTKQLGASIADAGASGSGGGGASLTGAEVMRSLVTAFQILLFCGALGLNLYGVLPTLALGLAGGSILLSWPMFHSARASSCVPPRCETAQTQMGSVVSSSPLLQAYLSVRRGLPNVEFLMTVAALGSVVLGDYVEAASVCDSFSMWAWRAGGSLHT